MVTQWETHTGQARSSQDEALVSYPSCWGGHFRDGACLQSPILLRVATMHSLVHVVVNTVNLTGSRIVKNEPSGTSVRDYLD